MYFKQQRVLRKRFSLGSGVARTKRLQTTKQIRSFYNTKDVNIDSESNEYVFCRKRVKNIFLDLTVEKGDYFFLKKQKMEKTIFGFVRYSITKKKKNTHF